MHVLVRIDKHRIASASDDNTIIVWEIATGRRLLTLTGHSGNVTALLVISRGDASAPVLVSGSKDRTIKVRHGHVEEDFLLMMADVGSR